MIFAHLLNTSHIKFWLLQVAYDVFTDLCEDCEWLDMLKL